MAWLADNSVTLPILITIAGFIIVAAALIRADGDDFATWAVLPLIIGQCLWAVIAAWLIFFAAHGIVWAVF